MLAYDLIERMRGGVAVRTAADAACARLGAEFGSGGLIAVSTAGEIATARTTSAMPWAAAWSGGRLASGA